MLDNRLLLHADRESLYCNERVCFFVCLCVCRPKYITGTTRLNVTTFLCMLPMAVVQSCSGGVVIRYVFPVLWMTSCFPIMGSYIIHTLYMIIQMHLSYSHDNIYMTETKVKYELIFGVNRNIIMVSPQAIYQVLTMHIFYHSMSMFCQQVPCTVQSLNIHIYHTITK